MKFAPRHAQLVGRMTIRKSESVIILTNEKEVTKFLLVDAVGPDAAAAGLRVGDLVVATMLKSIVFDAGTIYMPLVDEKDVALHVLEAPLDSLLVQVASGKGFVPFDSPDAAKSLGVPPLVRELEEAA